MSKKGLDTKVALCRLQNETDCMEKAKGIKTNNSNASCKKGINKNTVDLQQWST